MVLSLLFAIFSARYMEKVAQRIERIVIDEVAGSNPALLFFAHVKGD